MGAAEAKKPWSLIIIIHKTSPPGSRPGVRLSKKDVPQNKGPTSLVAFIYLFFLSLNHPAAHLKPRAPASGYEVILDSVEQKPNHFRRLRPLGRRDADVG